MEIVVRGLVFSSTITGKGRLVIGEYKILMTSLEEEV
jgi:hypothetical protein